MIQQSRSKLRYSVTAQKNRPPTMAPFPPKRKQALMNARSWEEKEVIMSLTLTAREPMHLF